MSVRSPQPSNSDRYFPSPTSSANAHASGSGSSSQSSMKKTLRKFRSWRGKEKVENNVKEEPRLGSTVQEVQDMDPYEELRPEVMEGAELDGTMKGRQGIPQVRVRAISDMSRGSNGDGYEWNMDSDAEDALAVEPDAYSWVDPSIIGTDQLAVTVSALLQSTK
jgi:hypothetical protein